MRFSGGWLYRNPYKTHTGTKNWGVEGYSKTHQVKIIKRPEPLHRSAKIQDTMDMVYTNEEQHRQTAQIRTRGERYR